MEKTNSTIGQSQDILKKCRDLFEKKTIDYGTSWRILRLSSVTDQIGIKAQRIRSIQEKGEQKIGDTIHDEFIGIINYSIIALMQSYIFKSDDNHYEIELDTESALNLYSMMMDDAIILMIDKNHDYGEAWRNMRISSITDLILQKLIRIKSIEDNNGKTLVSEGVEAGYLDIINYSIFSLILMLEEGK